VVYRMAPLPIPLNDLEGHFLFETFITPIPRETWHEFTNIARRVVPLVPLRQLSLLLQYCECRRAICFVATTDKRLWWHEI